MTGASPASQREKHSWMSPPATPQTFCINNWQYPEVSGAVQGHTRSWEPGSCRALPCTLSPRSQHPHAPGYGTPFPATARAADPLCSHLHGCIFLCPLGSHCLDLASVFYSCLLLYKLCGAFTLPLRSCRRLAPESSFSRSLVCEHGENVFFYLNKIKLTTTELAKKSKRNFKSYNAPVNVSRNLSLKKPDAKLI